MSRFDPTISSSTRSICFPAPLVTFGRAGSRARSTGPCPVADSRLATRRGLTRSRLPPMSSSDGSLVTTAARRRVSLAQAASRIASAGPHAAEEAVDHLHTPTGRAELAELIRGPRCRRGRRGPHDLAVFRSTSDAWSSCCAPPTLGARADDAAGEADHAERGASARHVLILGVEERCVVVPGLLPSRTASGPGSSRGPCPLHGRMVAFMVVATMKLLRRLRSGARRAPAPAAPTPGSGFSCSTIVASPHPAVCSKLGAARQSLARLVGPVCTGLDHPADHEWADGGVGAEDQRLLVPLRQDIELHVGILLRLDARADRDTSHSHPPRHRVIQIMTPSKSTHTPSTHFTCGRRMIRLFQKEKCFIYWVLRRRTIPTPGAQRPWTESAGLEHDPRGDHRHDVTFDGGVPEQQRHPLPAGRRQGQGGSSSQTFHGLQRSESVSAIGVAAGFATTRNGPTEPGPSLHETLEDRPVCGWSSAARQGGDLHAGVDCLDLGVGFVGGDGASAAGMVEEQREPPVDPGILGRSHADHPSTTRCQLLQRRRTHEHRVGAVSRHVIRL